MNIIVAPIVIPLFAAACCLLFSHRLAAQRVITGIATHSLLILAGYLLGSTRAGEVLVLRLGGWPGAYGIVFALDLFGSIMLCLTALVLVASWWYTIAGAIRRSQEVRYYHPLFMILVAGVNWAFITADLFNLFVSFELILISNYVLLIHTGGRTVYTEGIKFVVLNVIGGTFFLAGAGLAYGAYGTLNFAELAAKVARTESPQLAIAIGTLLMLIFAIKAALFPIFFWLPDAYPKAPLGVLPFFAGILTKVGVYCLYRVMTLIYAPFFDGWFQPLLLAIAACTMFFGVLGALGRNTFRHILSFHIISQIGYMIFGLGLFSGMGLAGGIFYIVHHIIVKSALFLVGGCVQLGTGTDRLGKVGGVVRSHPILAIAFLAAALSLAGIPPLSGFYGKFALLVEGFRQDFVFYTIISVLTSFLTLASMVKIWNGAFWDEQRMEKPQRSSIRGVIAATVGLTTVSLLVAVFSGQVMLMAVDAAHALLNPDNYMAAVLGREVAP